MSGKMSSIISDTRSFINDFLEHSNNNVSIIIFNSDGFIVSDLSNGKELVLSRFEDATSQHSMGSGSSNYYAAGSSVGVASDIVLEGYTFSDWTTEDAEIVNHSFVMPEGDVTLSQIIVFFW